MKKIIFVLIMLSLTITSFSKEKEAGTKEQKKIEMNEAEKRDIQKIRKEWKEFLSNVPEKSEIIKMDSREFKEICAVNEKKADRSYGKINRNKNRKFMFAGYEDMSNGVHVMRSYEELKNIAIGYVTPNTKYYNKPEIKNEIIEILDWLYDNAYHEGLPENGNWWQWELGIPKHLNNILILVYDDVPAEKRIKYLKASQYFQPYAEYSGVSPSASYSSSPDKRVSTGGNRMDTSIISFLRGVLMEDKVQIMDGVNAMGDVGKYVTTRDGFYKDGSFVQHGNVPYNGTYAEVVFDGLGSILYLTKGTAFETTDERINNVYESIINGYSYLFINGGVNDSVSGRAISRNNSSDLTRGKGLLNSMTLLSEGADEEYRKQIQSLIKTTISNNNLFNVLDKIDSQKIKGILKNLESNKDIKVVKKVGNKIFHSMDRAVSLNNKNGKTVISMHSSRIANYETMNNENIKGWYISDGMTYIYGTDSETFTEFWPTVDMYHLPGVTNSIKARGDKSGERRVHVSPKAWVGGSGNGKEAFVGMDMISWNKATKVKKSYFMTKDGAVFVAASNLRSNDGEIHTTIDNRIVKNGKIFLNGKEVKEETVIKNPENISLNFNENYKGENIGYKIVYAPELTVKLEEREGSWKNIGGTSETPIKKKYFKAYINHGENPKKAGFAYVILPMFSENEVNKYDTSRFEIKKLNEDVHIIKDRKENTLGLNFWKDTPMKEEGIKVYAALSFLVKENGEYVDIWVSDPTQLSNYNSIFEIDGKYELAECSTEKIKTKSEDGKMRIEIDLRNNGASEHIRLKKI